ncbi:MAG: hypothetical protein U0R80_01485 [Nocardioidaceae bacterium]
MIRRLATIAAALAALVTLGAGPALADHPRMMLGPGDAHVNGIKDKALVRWSKWGYVFIAGQQNSHLTVTYDETANTLRYEDTGTKTLMSVPDGCAEEDVDKGIAVVCAIPAEFDTKKMFVQVWVRLGDDFVDGSTLPARFRLWVLADAGKDVVYGGAGRDFTNGAKDADRVYGGAADDLLRTGLGNDQLWGGPGKDRLSCAEDADTAYRDSYDTFYQCETLLDDDTATKWW